MLNISFNYNGLITKVQCNLNDKFQNVIQLLKQKIEIDIQKVLFLYNGNKVDKTLTLNELANQNDKESKEMSVLIVGNTVIKEKEIKQREITCPKCYETILFNFKDYKINLFDCINNHKINNILLNEFENMLNMNLSNIICNICKNANKENTYNNEFYKCLNCIINICPLCKLNHDKTHHIINYDYKSFICKKHNNTYNKYCYDCKEDICISCEDSHKEHNLTCLEDIMPTKDDIINDFKNLREKMDKFKSKIKEFLNHLKDVIKNLERYYKISNNIILNYDIKYRNYSIFYNINEFKKANSIILNDLNRINIENSSINIFKEIEKIYLKMNNKKEKIIDNKSLFKDLKNIKIIKEKNISQRYLFNKTKKELYELNNQLLNVRKNINNIEKDNQKLSQNNSLKDIELNNFKLKQRMSYDKELESKKISLRTNSIDENLNNQKLNIQSQSIKAYLKSLNKNDNDRKNINDRRPNSTNKNIINTRYIQRPNSESKNRSLYRTNKNSKMYSSSSCSSEKLKNNLFSVKHSLDIEKNNNINKIIDINKINGYYESYYIKNCREINFIHIGKEGIELGEACWELFCLEHGISPYGSALPENIVGKVDSLFGLASNYKYVPRSIFIDSESSLVDKIKIGRYKNLFLPEQFIYGYEESSKLYSNRYSPNTKKIIEISLERIRHLSEYCNSLQGFCIFNSIGEGTGSGFTSLLLEELSNNFPNKIKFCFPIYPSNGKDDLIEIYNAIFSIKSSLDYSNMDFIFQNGAINTICQKKLDILHPKKTNRNRLIAQIISSITCPLRYNEKELQDGNMFQYISWLIPFPQLHFLLSSYAPICSYRVLSFENLSIKNITRLTFDKYSMMAECDEKYNKFISSGLIYRGNNIYSEEVKEICEFIKSKYDVRFGDWNQTEFKTIFNEQLPAFVPEGDLPKFKTTVCRISNSPCVQSIFEIFKQKINKVENIQSYILEGTEKQEIEEAQESLNLLENEFKNLKFNKKSIF